MKTIHFIFLLFFISGKVFSQNTYDVRVDSIKNILSIKTQSQLLIDSNKTLELRSIMTKTDFVALKNIQFPKLSGIEKSKNYWLNFTLYNPSLDTVRLLYTSGNFNQSSLYLIDDAGKIDSFKTSKKLNYSQRLYAFDYKYFPIKIAPKQSLKAFQLIEDYKFVDFKIAPTLEIQAYEARKRLDLIYDHIYPVALNYSIIAIDLFVAIFIFIQYIIIKQRYLLFYAFYLFSMALFSIYGFVFSPYVLHILSYSNFLKFDLQQNFYILISNLFYLLFIYEIVEIKKKGSVIQNQYFRISAISIFVLLFFDLVFSVVLKRLDLHFYIVVVSQIILSVIGLVSSFVIIVSKRLHTNLFIKLGSAVLTLAMIYGFLGMIFKWFPNDSELIEHYPNIIFNYLVGLEILLYSLAIGEKAVSFFREKNQLQHTIANSELSTLRSQINPHFLFNSLNSIKGLIIKNENKEAADYITEFGVLIRQILENSKMPLLSLKEELDFLGLYLNLESRRHKRFDYEVIIPENFDITIFNVPALLLQPIVENCIKHAFKGMKDKGKITIEIKPRKEHFEIIIADNGIGMPDNQDITENTSTHKSMGIDLIKDRLALVEKLYDWKIKLDLVSHRGTQIKFTIPYFS